MMSEKRRHHRSYSTLGRFPFLSCLTGVSAAEECPQPVSRSYEKLGTPAAAAADTLSGQKKPPSIQLGGRASPKVMRKSVSFSSVVLRDSKPGLGEKVKEACEQAFEVAKKSTPHISELFVGGQLVMQVTPVSVVPKHSKQKTYSPSIGFLHVDPPHHER